MRAALSILIKCIIFFCIFLIYAAIFEIGLHILLPDIRISKYSLFSDKSELYGWTLEPDQLYAIENPDSGEPIVFRTNSQGWKDVEHSIGKPDETFRILIVGDSYTFGIVPLEESFPRQLEKLFLQNGYNVEVISIGMGGWSTDQEFEVIKNEGMRYKPDLVILDFSFNDSMENLLPDNSKFKFGIFLYKPFKYQLSDHQLIKQVLPRDISFKTKLKYIFYSSAIVNRVRMLSASLRNKEMSDEDLKDIGRRAKNNLINDFNQFPYDRIFLIDGYENNLMTQRKILNLLLKEINEYINERDSQLIVYALTGDLNRRKWEIEFGRVIEEKGKDYVYFNNKLVEIDFFYEHKLIRELCREQGIDIIEPRAEYDRYILDPHTNETGNKEMALDIYEFLIEYEPFWEAMHTKGKNN